MKRSVFASALTLLFCSVTVSLAVAQAKPAVSQAKTAAPAAPAPAAKAGFVTPLKGEGTVLVLQGTSKFDPKLKEVTTTYKIKNTSSAPIAMLKMDEYWYEKGKMVSTDTQRYKQPFQPGADHRDDDARAGLWQSRRVAEEPHLLARQRQDQREGGQGLLRLAR